MPAKKPATLKRQAPNDHRTMFDRQSVCYVIQAAHGGPIKIGHARPLSERIGGLQTGNPYPLEVRAIFDGGRKTEKRLHELCSEYRMYGEWFAEPAIREIATEITLGHGLLWGSVWDDKPYPAPTPTAAEFRAKLRSIFTNPDGKALRALEETASDPKAKAYADAVALLRRYTA